MKRIAVIGENKNDTTPMCAVWNKKFAQKAHFKAILTGIKGDQLESPKLFKDLRAEIRANAFDGVIAIRDLDGIRTESKKIDLRNQWFEKVANCSSKSALLLFVYQIEALHYADASVFNKRFKVKIKEAPNPEFVRKPKEELKKASKRQGKVQFEESHNIDLIPKLDFTKIEQRCQFYRDFLVDLELLLKK